MTGEPKKTTHAEFLGLFKPFRGQIACVFGLGLLIAAIQPASVRITTRVIDELPKGTDSEMFHWVPWVLIVMFIISGFAKYFHNTMRRKIGEKVVLDLRTRLFTKYLQFPLKVFDKRASGDLLSTIQSDLTIINSGIETAGDMLREPFTFVALMVYAFYINWRLALATLIVAPIVAALFSRSGAAVKRYSSKNLLHLSFLLSLSQETIAGARVVKAFTLEETLLKKFRQIQDQYFRTLTKSINVQELAVPMVEFVGALLVAGIILFASIQAQQKLMSPGQLVGFIIAIGLTQMPIKKLNNAFLRWKAAESAVERVFALLNTPVPATVDAKVPVIPKFENEITFEKVGLYYDEHPVLKEISFTARRGQCVALVGASGSGKTSVVCLLPRLYELTSGKILVDGVDIREVDVLGLRQLISVVTQDVFLFNDTIYENILYGRPTATKDEVYEAARLAHCTEFIERTTNGFDTRIGDRGVGLSGGERQRLAIARAILRAAPILILDEATSNLDSHSEKMVQEALDELRVGKTTFLVAHRFSTIRHADQIIVMDRGEIKEMGTHDELVAHNGFYSGLLNRQLLTT